MYMELINLSMQIAKRLNGIYTSLINLPAVPLSFLRHLGPLDKRKEKKTSAPVDRPSVFVIEEIFLRHLLGLQAPPAPVPTPSPLFVPWPSKSP